MFYINYGTIIGLGIALLITKDLDPSLLWYTIFQITTGTIIFSIAFYRVCLRRQLQISPHLLDMEEETYKIDDREIEPYRNEVRRLSNYIMERSRTLSGRIEHTISEDNSALKSENYSPNRTIEQKDDTKSIESPGSEEDPSKARSSTEPIKKKSKLKLYRPPVQQTNNTGIDV